MDKKSVAKNYRFLAILLSCMVAGALLGWFRPKWGHSIAFLGTVFINMMFCVVVPLVFASIAGSVANMESRQRAGKIMGVTVGTFVITGAIAAVLMFVLPLIVFSILFGFSVQMTGGKDSSIGKWLAGLSDVMMKFVQIITYYAPIAFFAIFADLVATYGSEVAKGYGRALLVYYPLCFIYIFTAFPLFAWFGGGKGAVGIMFKHIARPAVVSLGTCSSVATIPTNMEEAVETGVSKDIAGMVLPLGATMHMDGSCFSCVLKIAFVLGVFGEQLSWSRLPFIVLVAVLSSVGMSGVPGGGYIGEYIICSIFFPTQMELAFPILVAIGNLVDPPATMINSAGDYVVSYIVSRFVEGKDWLQKQLNNA